MSVLQTSEDNIHVPEVSLLQVEYAQSPQSILTWEVLNSLPNLDSPLLACYHLPTLGTMARMFLDGNDKELSQGGLRKKFNWLKTIQMAGSTRLSHVMWSPFPIFASVPEFLDRFLLQTVDGSCKCQAFIMLTCLNPRERQRDSFPTTLSKVSKMNLIGLTWVTWAQPWTNLLPDGIAYSDVPSRWGGAESATLRLHWLSRITVNRKKFRQRMERGTHKNIKPPHLSLSDILSWTL